MAVEEFKVKEFTEGDFVYIDDGSYAGVFTVQQEKWVYRYNHTFNPIEVYDVEKGEYYAINDPDARHNIQLLPKERIPKIAAKILARKDAEIKEDKTLLEKVKESLQSVFPDKWDLHSTSRGGIVYTLIIKFPKIEIVNGKEGKHTIRDLYIKWQFTKGFVIKDPLVGIRGLVDYVEYKCGYAHSHLPHASYKSSSSSWSPFCLGSGEFAQANSEWRMTDHKFTQEGFELFLYQLDAYVKWESLQGGPYMRMENIAIGNSSRYLGRMEKYKEYKIVVRNLYNFPLKFDNVSKRFKVEEFLLEPIISEIKHISKIKKTSAGEYLHGDVSKHAILGWIAEGNNEGSKKSMFTFKGETIFFKVMELNEDHVDSHLIEVAHPDLTQFVASQLIKNTNHYFIKKYGV